MTVQAVEHSKSEALPMTGAELLATREYLGLARPWLAEHLVLNERRIQRMEADADEIPDALVALLDQAEADARSLVHELVVTYRRRVKSAAAEIRSRYTELGVPVEEWPDALVYLKTWRTPEGYTGKYSPQWHRMVCARVTESVPGLVLTY